MRTVRASVALIVAALALTACGSNTEELQSRGDADGESTAPSKEEPAVSRPTETATATPTPEALDLAVVNTGFGRLTYDQTTWWYTVVFTNPNPDRLFDFAEIVVEAIGADGTILDSSSEYLTILPGDSAITGTFFDVGTSEIDHLDVRGPVADDALPAPDDGLGAFSVAEVAATSDEYSTTVGGILTSTFASEQELVEVVVVASNPAGAIIGAEWTYVDRLPVEGRVRFEVSFFDPLPADTSYAVYPNL